MSSPRVVQQFPVEEEYKKDTGITPEDISQLRRWLDTQPHLPGNFITDLDLILAYHCCERSTAVTKQLLDLHFTVRTLFVRLFKDRVVDDQVLKTLKTILPLPLEGQSHQGYAVLYVRLINYDPRNLNFFEVVRALIMTLDLWQYEVGTWPGGELIVDLENVTLGHLARLELQVLQQGLYYLQEAVLLKLTAIHFLNAPSFMDKIMMILKPFLKKNFFNIIQVHETGSRTLYKFIPIEILPKEAGGKFKSFEQAKDDLIARFRANAEFFRAENKKRVVESLRPGRPQTISDIFEGVEGSFKKLDID